MIFKSLGNPLAVLITALGLVAISCGNQEDKTLPARMDITESVYSSVTIQPDSIYQAHASVSGLLEKNLVEEGTPVKKGQPILQIINSTPKLNAENAALNLKLARENYSGNNAVLAGLKDEIAAARLKQRNDSINYLRQQKLWQQNIGSEVEFENRKLAYELSSNQLQLLETQFERTKTELATKVAQAENTFQSARINSRDFTVSSEIDGTVYALYKEPGEIVSSMEALATIGSTDSFLIEMLVDEVDIVKIRTGQRTLVTLDAYGTQVFEALVSKIYPKKDERTQTFKVEAAFTDPPATLYPGLAGEGNIIIAEKKDALTIPKTYLTDDNKVITEKGPQVIQLGLESLEHVEILSGLDAETYIYKPEE